MPGQYVNPAVNTAEVAAVIDTATDTVVERFSQVTEFADDAMKTAMDFLNGLERGINSFIFTLPKIDKLFPSPISPSFNPGDPPAEPAVDLSLPAFPEAPILKAIALVTGIQAKLTADLATGGTGMNPAVEEQIWRREEERAVTAMEEARENIASEWSKRGFSLPDGVLVAQLAQAEIDYRDKRLDVSRDIAIKQYELAFQHGQFIIQQVLAMENLLIQATAEGNRTLIQQYSADMDGYKVRVQAAVEKLGAVVKRYQAAGDVYKSAAQAQAAIAEVDIKAFEAEINSTISQMQLYLKQAEINMHGSEATARLRVAAAEAGGRIAAQLAAGALSGVSVQAHLSAGASANKNYSGSEALSETYSHTATTP